jgi:hypothetical protein
MWRLALGAILAPLPRRWRSGFGLNEAIPWARAAALSGFAESLLAFVGLVHWYSHSVPTWAANAMDSALRNGPEAQVPGQAIGFAALVLWLIHPMTWCVVFFVLEGMVRLVAALFTEQIVATFPLAAVDWSIGKLTGRPLDGDAKYAPSAKEQLRTFVSSVKQGVMALRLPKLEDECQEIVEGNELFLEIRASLPKGEWIPPRVVKVGAGYFRLEQVSNGKPPRPFIFRLRPLAAGVPGRTVIVYERPSMGKD